MNPERRGERGKRKRKRGEGIAVVIVVKAEVATVDKVTGKAAARKGEMMAGVEEDTAAADQWSAPRRTPHTHLIERSLFAIAATVLTIIGATVCPKMTMQLPTRAQTATAQHMCTTVNRLLRSLRFGTQFVFHEL